MPIDFAINIFNQTFWFVMRFWWIIIPVILWEIFWNLWLDYVRSDYLKSMKWIVLNVHLPPEVEKTPKAMEQIFAALHSTYKKIGLVDKYWKGKVLDWFSFEIISRGGKTEFLIRLPESLKLFFESKIYAQYPYAEIEEVDDYAAFIPDDIPNDNYNVWGTELILVKEDAYPIKTHIHFEEKEEERRVDPLSLLLEVMSKLGEGESMFVQILVRPADNEWQKKGEEITAKMLGKKIPKEPEWYEEIYEWIGNYFRVLSGKPAEWSSDKKDEGPETKLSQMSPGEKKVLEAVEEKLSKFGFETGIRFLYLAPTEKFSMVNVAGIFGSFKQFGSMNLNSFKPNSEVSTSAKYLFKKTKEYRKKKNLLKAIKLRIFVKKKFILNVEELATIYHYPGHIMVGAPMMPRVQAKKGEPPATLPMGE